MSLFILSLLFSFSSLSSSSTSVCNETCTQFHPPTAAVTLCMNESKIIVIEIPSISFPQSLPSLRSSILFHGMHSSDSHIGSMLPTMRSMKRGLNVDVHLLETHTRQKKYNLDTNLNHTFIQLDEIKYFDEEVFSPMWTTSKGADYFAFAWIPGERALKKLARNHMKEFRPILDKEWDLVVCDDLFTVTGYSIALRNYQKHQKPYILMSTTLPTVYWTTLMSLGHTGIQRPSLYAPWDYTVTRFSHRLEAIGSAVLNGGGMKLINEYFLTTGPSLIGVNDYSISQLVSQATYYYLDDINYFSYPSPMGNDVVRVGLSCPMVEGKLPLEYENFMSGEGQKGTIYIAFGSNVPWKFAPSHHMKVFVEGLNHFKDYTIIFSFNGRSEQIKGIGKHIMVTNWAPQKEILSDNRTILYITHGGLKSMKESVCSSTPVLFMPLFAEQSHNAHLAKKEGFGEILFKKELSVEDFVEKVQKLLNEESYRTSIRKFKERMLDRPITAEDSVVFHTRRALSKHPQLNRFKRKGQFLSIFDHLQIIPFSILVIILFFLSK